MKNEGERVQRVWRQTGQTEEEPEGIDEEALCEHVSIRVSKTRGLSYNGLSDGVK